MFLTVTLLLLVIPLVSGEDVVHWSIGNMIISDPNVRFRLDMYSPTTPGSYPILVFLTGLSGSISTTHYKTLMTTIAQEKVIIVGLSKFENISPERMATHVADFLNWTVKPNDGIVLLFAKHEAVKGVIPDIERLGFLTHSAAGHPLAQYLNGTCGNLKLAVMMNPVDGTDPFGIDDDYITRMLQYYREIRPSDLIDLDPPTPLPYQMPTLIISAGYDSVPLHKGFPPCASNNMSNDRFYRSLYGPTFLVNFTNYGHGDNIDLPIYEAVKHVCTPCNGDICQFPQYKLDMANLITSFVYGIYNRDVKLLQVVQEPQQFLKTTVASKYDLHNYDYSTGGPGGFCKHD